ncbi:hypothetical protein [Rhodococcus daqingensis]|uniref:Uncharacterized protein n=1 Tax=Rhodococcus daqingensis TaxID=2479363 RepID=A0ABW2RVH8_9NOCA
MSRTTLSNRAFRRVAAGLAATALLAGGLVAGAGSAAAQGSADGFGSDGGSAILEGTLNGDVDWDWEHFPGSSGNPTAYGPIGTSATATFGNLEVTKAIIGRDARVAGETLTYRTTVTTADGSNREVTRLLAIEPGSPFGTLVPVDGSAKVSYTAADGTRKTEAAHPTWNTWTLPRGETRSGWELSTAGWQISAAKTLVLETTYRWRTDREILIGTGWVEDNIDTGVALDVPGLGIVAKPDMGMPVSCYKRCSTSRGLFGS